MTGSDKELNSILNVLVVEHDHEQSYVTGMLLVALGYKVHVCHSESDCIKLTETYRPDLILLDIDVPDMDGFGVCERIRRQANDRRLPIIAFTRLDTNPNCKGNAPTDFDGCLSKLAGYEELRAYLSSFFVSEPSR